MTDVEIIQMSQAMTGKLDWDDCIQETKERIRALRLSLKYLESAKKEDKPFPVDFPKPSSEQCFHFIEQ